MREDPRPIRDATPRCVRLRTRCVGKAGFLRTACGTSRAPPCIASGAQWRVVGPDLSRAAIVGGRQRRRIMSMNLPGTARHGGIHPFSRVDGLMRPRRALRSIPHRGCSRGRDDCFPAHAVAWVPIARSSQSPCDPLPHRRGFSNMAMKKKPGKAPAGKAAAERSASRNSDSGPSGAPRSGDADAPTRRAAETNAIAAAMPFNATKAAEYRDSRGGRRRHKARSVEPPSFEVTGSTLSETNRSPTRPARPPSVGFNPTRRPARSRARRSERPAR